MTKRSHDVEVRAVEPSRCRWCRRVLPERAATGRPRVYCRQACRQWDWVARQRARELQIGEDELVVARAELDALYDDLFVLGCAVDDVKRDLDDLAGADARELRDALAWVLDAARPLRDRALAPSTGTGPRQQRP
jgi:hypothetical protein